MNYEWNILHIKTKDYEGMPRAIHSARVEYIGANSEGNKGHYELLMTFPQPNPETFVAYENLTKEIVEGWLDAWMDEEHLAHAHAAIENELNENIVKRSNFLWV